MNERSLHTGCPVCGHTDIREIFQVIDYTVTQEQFGIRECMYCGLRFTWPVPEPSIMGKYYQSESYVSHSDSRQGIINRLYHGVRKFTLRRKKNWVNRYSGRSSGELLELGAGTGAFAKIMQDAGWQVTGLEPDAGARNLALKLNGIDLAGVEELFQLTPEKFDAIVLWHVLEHVHSLHEYMEYFRKLIKDNGVLFLAVPNYYSGDAGHYQKYWAGYDVPRHLYHFSPEAMKYLLTSHGFRLKTTRPMWFDAFYVSLLSERYKHGKNRLISGIVNGILSNFRAIFKKERCSSLVYVALPDQ